MDSCFVAVVILLQLVTLSADKVDLHNRPSEGKRWSDWIISGGFDGWRRTLDVLGNQRYMACTVSGQQPNSWLRSNLITFPRTVKRVDNTIVFTTRNCSNIGGDDFCKEYFDFYVHQSGNSTEPDPLKNNATYEKIAEITAPILGINKVVTKTFGVEVKGNYIVLAFHNQGSCSIIRSVTVSYNLCPEFIVVGSLVYFPSSMAPANNSAPVEGSCVTNAFNRQAMLSVNCQSDGVWNISSLRGRCYCREDMENRRGECKDCLSGKFNDESGLNCTVLPSAPRNSQVTFVNQSALELQWQPPEIFGDQTQVWYDVHCREPCDDNNCVDKACGIEVVFIPSKVKLNTAQVIVGNLSSFMNYTIKIYARNRVSEVAKNKHELEGFFETIAIRTTGSVPGKPEVVVEQPETAVVVSWTLKEKNGVMKEYHVTYTREDDLSETQTLATKEMEAHFDLKAGKTYEFRVFAINHIGRGPVEVKTYTLRKDSTVQTYLEVVYALAALLILCIMCFVCYIIWRRICQSRRNEIEATESNIRVYDDIQISSLAEYQNVVGFKLDREQITTVRVLGSGNFGQVSKAIYGPLKAEVAVKLLKDKALPKDAQDFLTELDLMRSLQPHPHVVTLIGCCIEKDPFLIVLEYLPYGDLLGYLRKSRGIQDNYNTGEKGPSSALDEKDLLCFAWMIADGMKYLASMKIVHRDLAARNVLVGDNKVCKISDFGLARDLEGGIYTRQTQARLPIKWMPPESLLYGTSTSMSDVWSYGIVMWEVFTIGESPYPGTKSLEVVDLLQTGYRMPRPAHISHELFSIMKECWEAQPSKRPTFEWLCSAIKRLLDDHKTYVNLEIYDSKNYVNFDMMMDKEG